MRPITIPTLALLGAALLLAGCPQVGTSGASGASTTSAFGSGSGSPTSGGSGSGPGTTSGGTTSGGTSAGTTASTTAGTSATSGGSSGTSGVACGAGGSPPVISCTSPSAGAQVNAGEAVEIDCTGPAGVGWSVTSSLAGATIQDRLSNNGRAYVTYNGAGLPLGFADTQVTVTVSACSPGGTPSSQAVSYTLVGNTLAARPYAGTVDAFTSDGVLKGNLIGPGRIYRPRLLLRLSDGTLLVGGEVDGTHDPLQHYDAQGNPASAWDILDHGGQALFGDYAIPTGAAEDGQGNVWVSAATESYTHTGKVYRFTTGGLYLDTLPSPSNLGGSSFDPRGVARLPNGDMVVTNAYHSDPYLALYPGGGTASTEVRLPVQICTDQGASATPSVTCASNSSYLYGGAQPLFTDGNLLYVGTDASSEALIMAYDGQLRFQLGTAQPAGGGSTDRGYYNIRLGGLTRSGKSLVASRASYGCLLQVDPRTLYDPNPTSSSWTCWNADHADIGAAGLVHLGP